MAPSAVTTVKDLGRSGLQTARRTACRCGRRVLAAALPAPRSPHRGDEGGKTRNSALEGRWSITSLPRASAPPNPLLPSEIKYSASLVRGQAVTHAVLGTLLFITGVLGTRHTGGGGTSSAGVWCGVSAIMCAVCGLMAHRLWYRNWAIKSFLLASTATAVLCVLGLGLTSYFAVLASYQQPFHHHPGSGYRYADGRYADGGANKEEAGGGVNGTAETSSEVKDMFFDLPPPPRTSQSLLGNLIVGLCAELLVSVWSLVVAWRGVQAEEFTVSRRDELVKEIIARAPASHALSRTTTVDAETNGSMPLAALYNLLQAHPELLTSKLQWGTECTHAPSSHASMDYRERVSRYLSNTLQPEVDTERNLSPSSITSLTKRQRSSSAPDEDQEGHRPGAATSRRRSRSKSEHRAKSKERRRKTKEPEVTEGGYSSSASSPMNSSSSPPETPSDSSPSSTLTRLESSDTSDTLDSKVILEYGGKQSQSLVLGLKTLSPLSSHVINPSEMMPRRKGKAATMQSETTTSVDNELATKHSKTTASVDNELATKHSKTTASVDNELATKHSKTTTNVDNELATKHSKTTASVDNELATKHSKTTASVDNELATKHSKTTASVDNELATKHSKTTTSVDNELATKHSKMTASVDNELATKHSKTTASVDNELATKHSKTTASVDNEVAKPAATMESNNEYNVSFVHTMDKPPPLPKKEYAKPTLVINEKLRQEADYMNKEQVSTSSKSSSSARVEETDTNGTQFHKQKLLKELSDRNEKKSASHSSKVSVVSEKCSTNTLLRRKKDKKPPPIPDKLHPAPKAEVPTTDRHDTQHLVENNNSTTRKEVEEKYTEIDLTNRIYSNLSDVTRDNTNTVPDSNEIYVNVPANSSRELPESRKEGKNRSCKQPLSIEIRPYENKTIVIKRDDRGKDSV